MRRTKKALYALGICLITLGITPCLSPDQGSEINIWEKLPDEKVQTCIKETEQKEDIPESAPVQIVETGRITKGLPQTAGEVNEFTYDDAQLLMKIAQAEGGNQGADGMWMIMSVVMNRADLDEWPDTIPEVIFQKHQFSAVSDGHFDAAEITPQAHEALARIESGDVCPDIVAFETADSGSLLQYFDEAFQYKDHIFYTKKLQ